jgi:hypothetical protein
MKAPLALIFAALLALILSPSSIASNVTGKSYQPDASSVLDPGLEGSVIYEDDTPEGASKVRKAKKRCGPKDKDCAKEK